MFPLRKRTLRLKSGVTRNFPHGLAREQWPAVMVVSSRYAQPPVSRDTQTRTMRPAPSSADRRRCLTRPTRPLSANCRKRRKPYGAIGKAVGLSGAAVRGSAALGRDRNHPDRRRHDPVQLTPRQAMIEEHERGFGRARRPIARKRRKYWHCRRRRVSTLLEAFTADDDDLLDPVMRIRRIPASTTVFTYLRLIEQRYDYGVR